MTKHALTGHIWRHNCPYCASFGWLKRAVLDLDNDVQDNARRISVRIAFAPAMCHAEHGFLWGNLVSY